MIIRRKAIDSLMGYTTGVIPLALICKLGHGDNSSSIDQHHCVLIIAQDALFHRDYLFSWYSTLFVTREPAELADENSG